MYTSKPGLHVRIDCVSNTLQTIISLMRDPGIALAQGSSSHYVIIIRTATNISFRKDDATTFNDLNLSLVVLPAVTSKKNIEKYKCMIIR